MLYRKEDAKEFFEEFLSTELGAKMEHANLLTSHNTRLLVEECKETYGDIFSVVEFAKAAKRVYWAYLNNELEIEEPAPEPVKKLTPSQEAWQECRIFTETHSAKDCENRTKIDRVYAAYLHKLRVGEFKATQATVPDAVANVNERKPEAKNIPDAVKVFAEDYKHMSCQQWKLLTNRDVNPEHIVDHYMDLFNRACEAGLI